MEDILRPIYQERSSHPNTLGVINFERKFNSTYDVHAFDTILLVIIKEAPKAVSVKHYTYGDNKASLHIVTQDQLNEWLLLGSNRKIVEWISNGKVVFDRNEYVSNLKKRFSVFPKEEREIKKGIEFAGLIRRYSEGRKLYENKHFLDAFNAVEHALHHLARLSVIEHGFHPETTVWKQVKQIEPQIHKLYHELVLSDESLEKRLELLFIASEYLIHQSTTIGAAHLLDIMHTKEEWTINELLSHPELVHYYVDIEMVVAFLVEKQFIKEVIQPTKSNSIWHVHYKL